MVCGATQSEGISNDWDKIKIAAIINILHFKGDPYKGKNVYLHLID
jgi:hypothetical protein